MCVDNWVAVSVGNDDVGKFTDVGNVCVDNIVTVSVGNGDVVAAINVVDVRADDEVTVTVGDVVKNECVGDNVVVTVGSDIGDWTIFVVDEDVGLYGGLEEVGLSVFVIHVTVVNVVCGVVVEDSVGSAGYSIDVEAGITKDAKFRVVGDDTVCVSDIGIDVAVIVVGAVKTKHHTICKFKSVQSHCWNSQIWQNIINILARSNKVQSWNTRSAILVFVYIERQVRSVLVCNSLFFFNFK